MKTASASMITLCLFVLLELFNNRESILRCFTSSCPLVVKIEKVLVIIAYGTGLSKPGMVILALVEYLLNWISMTYFNIPLHNNLILMNFLLPFLGVFSLTGLWDSVVDSSHCLRYNNCNSQYLQLLMKWKANICFIDVNAKSSSGNETICQQLFNDSPLIALALIMILLFILAFCFEKGFNVAPSSGAVGANEGSGQGTTSRTSSNSGTTGTTSGTSSNTRPGTTGTSNRSNPPTPKSPENLPTPKSSANPPTPKSSANSPTPKSTENPPTPKSSANPPTPKSSTNPPPPKSPANPTTPKSSANPPTPKSPENPSTSSCPPSSSTGRTHPVTSPPTLRPPVAPPTPKCPVTSPTSKLKSSKQGCTPISKCSRINVTPSSASCSCKRKAKNNENNGGGGGGDGYPNKTQKLNGKCPDCNSEFSIHLLDPTPQYCCKNCGNDAETGKADGLCSNCREILRDSVKRIMDEILIDVRNNLCDGCKGDFDDKNNKRRRRRDPPPPPPANRK